ncbi:MAG: GNAT family N-acetyltransferase [Clostridia bacterium]|nr:GNAT family N-acetyltransferase [Clostridia bacterium]
MHVRYISDNDYDKIAELYVHNHRTTYRNILSEDYFKSLTVEGARERWTKYSDDANSKIWVAYDNDDFLGFCACKKDNKLEDTWYIDSLHVSEKARGRGIGTKLIETAGRYACKSGYKSMSICVVKGNDKAKNLYLRLGALPFNEFEDDFLSERTNSEKLLWNKTDVFLSDD